MLKSCCDDDISQQLVIRRSSKVGHQYSSCVFLSSMRLWRMCWKKPYWYRSRTLVITDIGEKLISTSVCISNRNVATASLFIYKFICAQCICTAIEWWFSIDNNHLDHCFTRAADFHAHLYILQLIFPHLGSQFCSMGGHWLSVDGFTTWLFAVRRHYFPLSCRQRRRLRSMLTLLVRRRLYAVLSNCSFGGDRLCWKTDLKESERICEVVWVYGTAAKGS